MNVKAARKLVDLLRAKALNMAKRSEGNDNLKGYWQAGQAEGLGWAADHLEVLLNETKLTERCKRAE